MSKLLPTIIGGAIGVGLATAGFLGGGPAGAWIGWSVGTTVGGLVGSLMDKPKIASSPLGDLRFSGSTYGTTIPWLWGKNKLAGNVTWVANYRNNKTLVPSSTALTEAGITHLKYKEKKQKSGGGGCLGGGGSSTKYKVFYASYQVTFAQSSVLYANGSIISRSPTIRKIWADDILIYDVSNPSANKVTIRFNYGGETNSPDTLIVAAEAPGHPENVCADRGKISIVIENHDLTNHGGRIPTAIRAEIWTNSVTLGDIINDICGPVGLYGSYIDTSLCTQSVTGFALTDQFTAQSALDGIIKYFFTDAIEADGKLRFVPRGGAITATISSSELGASLKSDSESGGSLSRVRGVRSEVPGKMEVLYYDVDKNYQQLTQTDIKQTANFRNDASVTLPMTLAATEARRIAAFLLDSGFLEVDSFQFTLSWGWSWLCPTDCVYITDNGQNYRVRITSVDREEGGVLGISALIDNPAATTQVIVGDSGGGGGVDSGGGTYPVTFTLRSDFALTDNEKGLSGFYIWGNWDEKGNGGTIYYSTDSGTTWIEAGALSSRSAFGIVSTTSSVPSGHDYWESSSSTYADIVISPFYDQVPLTTLSDSAVLNGDNVFLFGDEIVGFVNVTDNGTGHYRVSRLRRAMSNTPVTCNGFANGDSIYQLSDGMVFVDVPDVFVGTTVQVKVVAPGQTLADVSAQNVTIAAATPTDAEKLLTSGVFPYMITPYTVASDNSGTRTAVSWTTVDLSSKLIPGTKYAQLYLEAIDSGNTTDTQSISFRENSSGQTYTGTEGKILTAGMGLNLSNTVTVPVNSSLTIDYKVDTGFLDGWKIVLYGGFAPLQ